MFVRFRVHDGFEWEHGDHMHVGLKWRQLTLTQLETQPRPRPAARLQKWDVMRRPAMVPPVHVRYVSVTHLC